MQKTVVIQLKWNSFDFLHKKKIIRTHTFSYCFPLRPSFSHSLYPKHHVLRMFLLLDKQLCNWVVWAAFEMEGGDFIHKGRHHVALLNRRCLFRKWLKHLSRIPPEVHSVVHTVNQVQPNTTRHIKADKNNKKEKQQLTTIIEK